MSDFQPIPKASDQCRRKNFEKHSSSKTSLSLVKFRWCHQEKSRRAGTENVASIIGMGIAAEIALDRVAQDAAQVRKLRDHLEALLLESCPDSRVNGAKLPRLPNTLNITFRYLEGESMLVLLD